MLTAIVGINWGDEGKGRMVDLLSERYDIVVRYQGGNNAGHTVVNEKGKFILNLMPSGILRDGTVNVLGPGMVIDLEHLCGEVRRLREEGLRAKLILQVHDELIVEAPEAEARQVQALVQEEMEAAVSLAVPMEVDAKTGKDWGEAH